MHSDTTVTRLRHLAEVNHEACVKKGFWPAEGRDTEECLALITGEMFEAVNAPRANKSADLDKYDEVIDRPWDQEVRRMGFERFIKDTVQDEIADTVLRILDLTEHFRCTADVLDMRGVVGTGTCTSFAGKLYRISREMPTWTDGGQRFKISISLVLWSLIHLAEDMDFDLLWHMAEKISYNKTRAHKHGASY